MSVDLGRGRWSRISRSLWQTGACHDRDAGIAEERQSAVGWPRRRVLDQVVLDQVVLDQVVLDQVVLEHVVLDQVAHGDVAPSARRGNAGQFQ
jgi:hypothetical protein